MGGYNSGRRAVKKSKLDDCLQLDINRLIKMSGVKQGGAYSGHVYWRSERAGTLASIAYDINIRNADDAHMRLSYKTTDKENGIEKAHDYKIALSVTRPHYGGQRYWFLCETTGKRVSVLYLHEGKFISRHACGFSYATQSMNAFDRACERKWKVGNKICDPVTKQPSRPRHMHYKTYFKMLDEFNQRHIECFTYIPKPKER